MSSRAMPVCAAVALAMGVAACRGPHQPRPGTVLDEAMRAGVAPKDLVRPTDDYFRDMDFNVVDGRRPTFTQEQVEGRNMWIVWTGGNDRLWDRLTVDSLGTFDLLKTISSHPKRPCDTRVRRGYGRHNRWKYLGLVNEPCFKEATGPDPNRFGCGWTFATRHVRPIRLPTRRSTRGSRSARAARPCRSAPTTASRRASSACGCFRIRISTRRRASGGTPERFYNDPELLLRPGSRAAVPRRDVVRVLSRRTRIRSSRPPIPRIRSGRT